MKIHNLIVLTIIVVLLCVLSLTHACGSCGFGQKQTRDGKCEEPSNVLYYNGVGWDFIINWLNEKKIVIWWN